ncbi:membrane protein YfhO [Mucilaginibacter frigoritolerans]|uniref:Membrane protein YfhO n=1 Tax=Mucilaginibacter frigoritolerans TaxID=652788 RepID=A0A562U3J4_9SPHI|nr:YfhO family protein [Mucilaginibacter frigoritolerans]TWI99884.1 membrane protein YfhO [Mucilaginibacter frigoritolerans]
MNNWFKRNSIHFLIAAIFLVICFLYFTPAFQGKTLGQVDVFGAQSTQKEINDYKAKDTTILWTNQIFGGMPTYQIWAPYANNIASTVVNVLIAVFPNPIYDVLLFLFGTYFLFSVLKLNPWFAAAGAVAFTFSSYNIILLVAGHSNQALAIAFFAPIIASVLLTLRGRYILGGSLTALFMALEFKANHIQMTYYLLMALVILVCIELYHAIKSKTTPAFLKSMAYLGGALVLALLVNASLLWSTLEYSKYSYRGPSNLTQHTKEPSNGLSKTYAYEWSQGVGECLTFLVPNAYGGASGPSEAIDQNSATAKVFLDKNIPADQAVNYAQQISGIPGLNMYWGNKPGTSGPFYFGAVICFLFLFGLLIVKSRLKWWLLGTVVLTMLLSFGGNWPYVSDLFFNYFPLYNKFRAVESILAVAGICFPILAFLAVQEIVNATDKNAILKKLYLSFYIVGGLTLLLIALPQLLLSFKSTDAQTGINYLTQAFKGDSATANSVANAIVSDRIDLERADAVRTLIFVVITFGLIWLFIKQKVNLTVLSLGLFAIVLIDMWQVDKRYLKEANFQEKQDANQVVKPREVDTFIARDPDPDFRVFDLTAEIKNDETNPFFHKSISGYSAARLKRYDELMDNQLATNPPNHDVLDMLNTKYFITQGQSQSISMQANSTACGHAWFVKSVKLVDNSDQEMQAISSFAPKDEAIVDKQYKHLFDGTQLSTDPSATITLTHYNPDHMTYQSGSTTAQIAVFSEIYYDKGWKMYIDGKEQPYFRADYLLRAALIPVGNHKIEFIFHPASYYTGEKISLAGSILLVLALGGAVYTENKKKKPVVAAKKA